MLDRLLPELSGEELEDFGSDDPQPGDSDFDPSVPPCVVELRTPSLEHRFLLDPEKGVCGFAFGKDHARVISFRCSRRR